MGTRATPAPRSEEPRLNGDAGPAFPEMPQATPSRPCLLLAPGLREKQGQGLTWALWPGSDLYLVAVDSGEGFCPFPHRAHCTLNTRVSQAYCVPGTVLGAGDTGVRKAEGLPVLTASSGWVGHAASRCHALWGRGARRFLAVNFSQGRRWRVTQLASVLAVLPLDPDQP